MPWHSTEAEGAATVERGLRGGGGRRGETVSDRGGFDPVLGVELPRMWKTWTLAVLTLITSVAAIWWLVSPRATRPRTSASRGVSPSSSSSPERWSVGWLGGTRSSRARCASRRISSRSGRAPSRPQAAEPFLGAAEVGKVDPEDSQRPELRPSCADLPGQLERLLADLA